MDSCRTLRQCGLRRGAAVNSTTADNNLDREAVVALNVKVICELASLARDKVATRAFVIGLWECADDFPIILLARGDSE